MFTELRRRRALERVKPGNGRPLKRFRWWQHLSRALYSIRLDGDLYTVDVPLWRRLTTEDGKASAHLYVNGRHYAESKLPALFEVPGGTIEVKPSSFGLKRSHYVTGDGAERQLTPDPASAEGRRARLAAEHPVLSGAIGGLSLLVLVVSLALLLMQLAEKLSQIPPVAEQVGTFTSFVTLTGWANFALGVAAAVASTERALRLRYSRILDGS
ncbi:hypothetical protein [Paractinoplanes lichenicola]|uniref:PEGA domain-containing protein n=1 Tax=Paractinoplanes lichenicola TaxID=2802976 RepID=A0ABS1VE47_9ACTN|nr:hypothetical protein [Actinoplanes lichenicola]MBL7252948.1 hypothetical protein [Actinoplanes lichenicola]